MIDDTDLSIWFSLLLRSIVPFCILPSAIMQTSNRPRRCKRNVMFENDADAAEFVTFEDVMVTSRTGNTTMKRVKVALDLDESEQIPDVRTSHPPDDYIPHDLDVADEVPIVLPKPRKVKLWIRLMKLN